MIIALNITKLYRAIGARVLRFNCSHACYHLLFIRAHFKYAKANVINR